VDRWREPVRVYHSDAYMSALDGRLGETYRWEDGDDEGEVTAVRDGYSGDKYCREFRQQVTIGGERQEAYGAACQQPDGSWQIVPHNP
jgi:surface antigen